MMHFFAPAPTPAAWRMRACGKVLTVGMLLWVGAARAGGESVTIENFTFKPAELTVARGTTVTWTNGDDIPHTVTASGKAFKSKPLDTSDRFSFTFTEPGEYGYFCSLHPHMTGKIIVKAP